MGKIKSALWQMITEPNNHTVCPVRLMVIIGFIQFVILASWHAHRCGQFDVQAHCVGLAALFGGAGAALGLKKDSPQ